VIPVQPDKIAEQLLESNRPNKMAKLFGPIPIFNIGARNPPLSQLKIKLTFPDIASLINIVQHGLRSIAVFIMKPPVNVSQIPLLNSIVDYVLDTLQMLCSPKLQECTTLRDLVWTMLHLTSGLIVLTHNLVDGDKPLPHPLSTTLSSGIVTTLGIFYGLKLVLTKPSHTVIINQIDRTLSPSIPLLPRQASELNRKIRKSLTTNFTAINPATHHKFILHNQVMFYNRLIYTLGSDSFHQMPFGDTNNIKWSAWAAQVSTSLPMHEIPLTPLIRGQIQEIIESRLAVLERTNWASKLKRPNNDSPQSNPYKKVKVLPTEDPNSLPQYPCPPLENPDSQDQQPDPQDQQPEPQDQQLVEYPESPEIDQPQSPGQTLNSLVVDNAAPSAPDELGIRGAPIESTTADPEPISFDDALTEFALIFDDLQQPPMPPTTVPIRIDDLKTIKSQVEAVSCILTPLVTCLANVTRILNDIPI